MSFSLADGLMSAPKGRTGGHGTCRVPLPSDRVTCWAVTIHPQSLPSGCMSFGVLANDDFVDIVHHSATYSLDSFSGWHGWRHRAMAVECGVVRQQNQRFILNSGNTLLFRFDPFSSSLLLGFPNSSQPIYVSIRVATSQPVHFHAFFSEFGQKALVREATPAEQLVLQSKVS
jgi:hypothetical protein